jgi:peptidoglycan/xylan/chitin deacetylase (PgdA/CDA1 family)
VRSSRALRRAARRLCRPFERRAAILLYHRVADLDRDPWSLAVRPDRFEEQLRVVIDRYRPVSLSDLATGLEVDDVPRGAVAFTFDDGYADNFEAALPRLRAHRVPATVFLVAGAIGTRGELWWDELEAIVLAPGRLPPILDLSLGDEVLAFDLEESVVYSAEEAALNRGWRAGEPAPNSRHSLYLALWERLKPLATPVREEAMAGLRGWAGREPARRTSHRLATWEAILEARSEPLLELGAHTIGHPALSALSTDLQREEIAAARNRLEERIGAGRVKSFSYPFGDHGPGTPALVREAGYRYACAGSRGVVQSGTDPLLLPRLHVPDVGGTEFRRWLGRWL